MLNATLDYVAGTERRTKWFKDFLPQHLQDIECLVTSIMTGKFPSLAEGKACYSLAYDVRDGSLLPTCCTYGASNLVFFLNSSVQVNSDIDSVVFRLPFPDRQFAMELYQAEYATLRHVSANTKIPVPIPYDVGFCKTLQSPYLLQSCIDGIPLDRFVLQWDGLPADKLEYLRYQLSEILQQLLALDFPAIGSLSASGSLLRPMDLDVACATVSEDSLERLLPKSKTFSNKGDYYDFLAALRDLEWRERDDTYVRFDETKRREKFKLEHVRSQQLVHALSSWKSRVKTPPIFKLQHPDIRAGNILINKRAQIMGIIDWESAHVVPLALYRLPTFGPVACMLDDDGDNWWQTYQRDSVTLLPAGAIDSSGFDYRSYFEAMTESDFLLARSLRNLEPLHWAMPAFEKLLEQTKIPPWSQADQAAIDERLAKTQEALMVIDATLTAEQKADAWNDDKPETLHFLGPTISDAFLLACSIPLPP